MKNIHILVIFIIGMILIVIGAFLKLQKISAASLPLILGLTFEAVAILMLLLKMTKKKDKDDNFLES